MSLQKPNTDKPAGVILPKWKDRVQASKCTTCDKDIKEADFRNELSKREYSISGMCQECQDSFFGKD